MKKQEERLNESVLSVRNNKKEYRTYVQDYSGITLIALIITIIVMLILVGVTVNVALDGGLFGKAREGVRKTQIAEVAELAQEEIVLEIANNGDITKEKLKNILDRYFKELPDPLPNNLEGAMGTLRDEYGGYTDVPLSDIYSGGITTPGIKAADVASDLSNFIGKTVTGYTSEKASNYQWQIFYADSSNIYLISSYFINYSDIPTKDGKVLTKKSTDYIIDFSEEVLNLYNGSSDITDSRLKTLNKDYFDKNFSSEDNNMKAVAYMLDTSIWNTFKDNNADYVIGGPTVELFFNSYNAKYGTKYEAQAYSNKGYKIRENNGNLKDSFSLSEGYQRI